MGAAEKSNFFGGVSEVGLVLEGGRRWKKAQKKATSVHEGGLEFFLAPGEGFEPPTG